MSRFYWVRHGPTHAKAMVGWTDLPADLSDSAQIARLKAHLPQGALLISSDLVRASATADAISAGHDRLPHNADLREIHFGAWEMLAFDEIEDQAHIRSFWDHPGDVRPPGGESWHDVVARVDRAVAKIRSAHPNRDVIIVAHFGAILTQVQQALQVGAYEAFSHRIDNLSVTELYWDGARWHAGRINHIP